MPLKRCSRQVIFINTSPPEDRVYLLKANVDQLPDDADVAESNLISRYANRSSKLEEICLAEYAAFYDSSCLSTEVSNSDDDVGSGSDTDEGPSVTLPKRRATARIIRTVHFNPLRDSEKSAREKLMLYIPWRNEEADLHGRYQSYSEHFDSVKEHLSALIQTYEPFAQEVSTAQETLANAEPQEQWDRLAPGLLHSDESDGAAGFQQSLLHADIHPDLHGQGRDYDIALDLGLGHVESLESTTRYDMSDDEYFTLMQSLNSQQMDFVSDTLHILKTSNQPFYRFLSGGAGTGKSYVLKAIRESAERYFKTRPGVDFEHHWTMTLAPTGKAAFIASGATIHSVLHVPCNQSLTYHRLDHESLNTLRVQIGHIRLWLIDEISMVGHRLFSFIDQRLQEVNSTNSPFGGCSVIAFGDFFQLPPVMDGFIFQDFSSAKFSPEDYNPLAPNLWTDLFTMYELTQIMRQQNCIPFANLLNRLREGNYTSDDIQTLSTRVTSPETPGYPTSALHLFKTNSLVDQHNTRVYDKSTSHKVIVSAVDSVVGSVSADMAERVMSLIPQDSRRTMQLAERIPLCVGCRYEISVNLSVSDGLTNGAGGILKAIQLTSHNNSAAGLIWIQFDDIRVGAQTRRESKSLYRPGIESPWTPIQPLTRQFQVGRSQSSQVMRKQFPVRQSAAKTIHRSQGDTLDSVVLDFTTARKEAHIHYVGLSRVTSIDGLYILNLCADKIHISNDVKSEVAKLRTERSTHLAMYRPHSVDASACFQIAFLNARSLHKHIDCIRKDQSLMACDVLLFCETRSSPDDSPELFHLDNFGAVLYSCQSTSSCRSHYGLAMYSKFDIVFHEQPVTFSQSHETAEAFFTVVGAHSKLLIVLACVYRRPNTDLAHFRTAMSELLAQFQRVTGDDADVQLHYVVIGDFNLDWFDESAKRLMSDVFAGYRQLVSEVTTDFGSILDHVYTTLPENAVQCYVTDSYFTDHKPVVLSFPTAGSA